MAPTPPDSGSADQPDRSSHARVPSTSRRLPFLTVESRPVRAGVVAAGSTALVTLLVTGASAAVQASRPAGGLAWIFGELMSSFLLLGMVAALANFAIGAVRWKKPAGGLKGTLITALFLALAFPVVVYMVSVVWMPSALYVFISLLLICIPAGILFAIIARLPLGPRQRDVR
ncbi:hypothetical protein [Brevibacterium gallinarum]|uniref:Uncharacterized protein n=1 Tax=Brevibacterium gallinarum TaxID=2762220 RepID=A0ABR8WW41_9MICO|nr:hypothetical protein [Brevibacterium gallinarum]MBD8021210.1 hypothetical protein [Brevibacterium gallinarum]